jgi:hypothetical protein
MGGGRKFQARTRRFWGGLLATLEPSWTEITRSTGGVPLNADDDDDYYSLYLFIFDNSNTKDYPCTQVQAGIRIPVPAPSWRACLREPDLPALWWRLCVHGLRSHQVNVN